MGVRFIAGRYRWSATWLLLLSAWMLHLAFGQEFIGLGSLGAGFRNAALGVSADGSVVVGWTDSITNGGIEAFLWTPSGGIEPLGDLGGGAYESMAYAVSADGRVIVGYGTPASEQPLAFRWTLDTLMQSLGSLPTIYPESKAFGVSADGNVIVGYSNYDFPGRYTAPCAFRWTRSTGMIPLGTLNPQQPYSIAYEVSADGAVVVGLSSAAGGYVAFRWTSSGGMRSLGRLPGVPSGEVPYSAALSISSDGMVVVGWSTSTQGFQAFRWSAATGMQPLGDLPGGLFESRALAVSGNGAIVVGTSATGWQPWGEPKYEAFIWDSQHGMRRLLDVLVNEYRLGEQLRGWTLESASAITPDGAVIVGTGRRAGQQEAWLARLSRSGDVNGDGCVDDADLLAVLFAFGCNASCGSEDVNGDSAVDDADLLQVLFGFGGGCG